ncbi:TCR/Tet family MFS transporter [Caulobacter mirabilis]|uniref:Tetracycline resistance MFS efflux pump n=1 Tax=Caulobacter mirabilis TaxID=69666 RepID=A0A2D2AX59_9CAUL|nr:TCR/Tet family MFS transporter [Caulobacter mirabilis]ATQ42586.1 tetracycline resistance MFS efflux pump [Caulobacter mirabilis]
MTETSDAPQDHPGGVRRAAFGFIFASALINNLSFGIMIPVVPKLVEQLAGGDTAAAGDWNALLGATWGLMQFLFGPILGMLSDRYGRRPVLLISIFGLGVDFILMALAPDMWWLLVARMISGITASSFSTANAYVADVVPPEGRAKAFGIMGSAFSFGFLIGPVVGAFLGQENLHLPFFAAAALCLINFVYGLFVLPESLAPEKRTAAFVWAKANPIGSLQLLRSHKDLLGLAVVGFLFYLAHMVLPAVFVLYMGHRYDWDIRTIGFAMSGAGVLGIIVQVFLVGPIVKRIGERGTLLAGAFFGALGFAMYGFAPNGWFYLWTMPVFAFMSLLMPGLMGLMSRRVPPQEQGRLQGAMQSLQGVASIFGPLIFGTVFAWSLRHEATTHLPGLAVYLAAALLLAAFLLALKVAKAPEAEPQAA